MLFTYKTSYTTFATQHGTHEKLRDLNFIGNNAVYFHQSDITNNLINCCHNSLINCILRTNDFQEPNQYSVYKSSSKISNKVLTEINKNWQNKLTTSIMMRYTSGIQFRSKFIYIYLFAWLYIYWAKHRLHWTTMQNKTNIQIIKLKVIIKQYRRQYIETSQRLRYFICEDIRAVYNSHVRRRTTRECV